MTRDLCVRTVIFAYSVCTPSLLLPVSCGSWCYERAITAYLEHNNEGKCLHIVITDTFLDVLAWMSLEAESVVQRVDQLCFSDSVIFPELCLTARAWELFMVEGREDWQPLFPQGDCSVWYWSRPLSPARFCLSIWEGEKQYSLVWYGSDCQEPCDPHRAGDTSCYSSQTLPCD